MKKVLKVCGVPLMLAVKMIVVLLGAMIFFFGIMLSISNGIIGVILSVISGIGTTITLFGMGLYIYNEQYQLLFGIAVILAIFTLLTILPKVAEIALEYVSEFGAKAISTAVHDIPLLLEI